MDSSAILTRLVVEDMTCWKFPGRTQRRWHQQHIPHKKCDSIGMKAMAFKAFSFQTTQNCTRNLQNVRWLNIPKDQLRTVYRISMNFLHCLFLKFQMLLEFEPPTRLPRQLPIDEFLDLAEKKEKVGFPRAAAKNPGIYWFKVFRLKPGNFTLFPP